MISTVRSAGLLLLLFAGAQAHPEETPFARKYHAFVDAYRDGGLEQPIEGVLELDQDRLQGVVQRYLALVRRGFVLDFDAEFFQAASALHADAALHAWRAGQDDAAAFQLDLGRVLVDASEPADGGPGSFRRRWYAAAALLAASHLRAVDALKHFERALEAVPGDVPLLTAAAWFSERLSDGAADAGAAPRNSQVVRRRHQRTAERYLTEAIELDPRAEEPALRLARIEMLMGRDARAGGRLTALLAREDLVPFTAYLGRLFLGDIRAREGNRAEAEWLFREALALHPIAQSARVALAEILYATGDSAGAAQAIEPLATRSDARERNDPWSDYQLAYPQVGILLLDELRDEVQR